jgi:hypothetical protein
MFRDMPRNRWGRELDSFSRQHEGWLVSVTTRDRNGQLRVQALDLPLRGVSQTGPHSAHLAVEVGDEQQHLTHEIHDVTAMTIEMTDTQAERALIIDSADRTETIVTFRSPMRPEDVDGLPVTRHQ